MSAPQGIDELLAAARRRLRRVAPDEVAGLLAAGALVVDIRPFENRSVEGEIPGAVVIDRNVLEWRLDPTCEHRIPEAVDHDVHVVIVCNEGYQSSLAAATLQDLGLHRATDLTGGYRAWRALDPTDEQGRPDLVTGAAR